VLHRRAKLHLSPWSGRFLPGFGHGAAVMACSLLATVIFWLVGITNAINCVDAPRWPGPPVWVAIRRESLLVVEFQPAASRRWPAGCRPGRGLFPGFCVSQLQPARIFMGDGAPISSGLPWRLISICGPARGFTTVSDCLFSPADLFAALGGDHLSAVIMAAE